MNHYINNLKESFKNNELNIIDHDKCLESAVLIPLVIIDNIIHVIFQVRSKNLLSQPGEISFPGGKREINDIDFKMTSIRETCEELGITNDNIEIISQMNTFVAPFNIIIHPFLGTIKNYSEIKINEDEVDHIFTVPLKYFFETNPEIYISKVSIQPEDNFPFSLITNGEKYDFKTGNYEIYFYTYNNYVIWGITAKIINDFIKQCNKKNLNISSL